MYVGGGQSLRELTETGELVATHDLSDVELGTTQGMIVAPSGDQTDDPSETSIYVADSGGSRQAVGQAML